MPLEGEKTPSDGLLRLTWRLYWNSYLPMSAMQQRRLVLLCALLVSACTFFGGGDADPQTDGNAASSSIRSVAQTANVTYTGTVREAGISVYQEGTHRLILSDGRFILLESDEVDLNGYVGEQAEVFGTVRPTVEEGGVIMRVERITLADGTEISSASASEAASAASSVARSSESTPVTASSVRPASSLTTASQAASSAAVPAGRVEAMAQADLSAGQWTQQYCSTHIGFCFPVHRNWWYQSFGTTTSNLWHVEISSEEITSLGQGPLVVRLVSGALQGGDGAVNVSGGVATGQRAWTDDRHFEVAGDARLETAIRYITSSIEASEEESL